MNEHKRSLIVVPYTEKPTERQRLDRVAEKLIPIRDAQPSLQITFIRKDTSRRDPPPQRALAALLEKIYNRVAPGTLWYDPPTDAQFIVTSYRVAQWCAELLHDCGFEFYADAARPELSKVPEYKLEVWTKSTQPEEKSDE